MECMSMVSGQNGPKSKHPQVKTSPNWSKRPQLQLQIGQNRHKKPAPKMAPNWQDLSKKKYM